MIRMQILLLGAGSSSSLNLLQLATSLPVNMVELYRRSSMHNIVQFSDGPITNDTN
jgi:hypothetical protein